MDLQGRTVLVTGGGRGIGRGIAEGFARRGARVAVADLGALASASGGWAYPLAGRADLQETVARLEALGAEAFAVEADVARADSCAALVSAVLERFGRLDVLVNNAGLLKLGPVVSFDEADWDRMFDVNVKGYFLMARAAIPALTRDGGAMINVASVCGKSGFAMTATYCATKFAVIGLTQALARELAPQGVRVNAVCPGFVTTAMLDHMEDVGVWQAIGFAGGPEGRRQALRTLVPLGEAQTPEDVAEAAVYLAAASSVTGVALPVAGGQVMD